MRDSSKNVLVCLLVVLSIAMGFSACTKYTYQKAGTWHTLKAGENLSGLATQYSVAVDAIKRANDIYDPQDLSPGMKLLIPKAQKAEVPAPKPVKKPALAKTRFIWPCQGTISSGFGVRHGKMHEGIDMTKDKGRDIRAAGSGVVEFAGTKSGYGKAIIINHGGGYQTLYAHNQKLYVRKNMKVKQGVIISRMGSTGKSIGIHLHFEVRLHKKPQNPLRYLPVR
jgi:murein DD-endopeptidase MepM/ murein hydrolase activator NlpD